MSSCPLCHSQLSEEAGTCAFCGASPRTRMKKLGEKALRDLFEEASVELEGKPEGLDSRFARSLLEKGLKSVEEGDFETASRIGQALQRGLDLAKRRSAYMASIRNAKEQVRTATKAGINVERAVADIHSLEERVSQGTLTGVPRALSSILKRIDASGQIRQAERSITAASKRISYAMERGGKIARATDLLESAKKALEEGDVPRTNDMVKKAVTAADYARKTARAGQLISNVEKALKKADDRGANVSEAQELLEKARKALKSGVYADVQKWTRASRDSAERARRERISEEAIQRVEKLLQEEAKEGSDLTAAQPHLEEAWKALGQGKFSVVTKSLQKCRKVAQEAARVRRAKESLELLQGEIQDVRSMRADTSKSMAAFEMAEKAFESGDWKALRKHFQKSTRAVKAARKEREREFILTTVEKLVEKAGKGGVSALGARELLSEVESALGQGRYTEIDRLVEAKFEAEATKKENKILRGSAELRTFVAEFKIAGLEVSGALGFLDRAEEALEAGRLSQAEELLKKAQDASKALEEGLRGSAERSILDLEEEIDRLKGLEIQVPEAQEFLDRTKKALEEGKSFEALDLAKMAMEACREARKEHSDEVPLPGLEGMEEATTEERAREVVREARSLHATLERAGIYGKVLEEAASRAEDAIASEDMTSLNLRTRVLHELVSRFEAALLSRLNSLVEELKASMDESEAEGQDVEKELRGIQDAINEDSLERALDEYLALKDKTDTAKAMRAEEELKAEEEITTQFFRVRALLSELERAGIDIGEAQEGMEEATVALGHKDIERAGAILSDLEEIASGARSSMASAARDVIDSARQRLERAAKHWDGIPDAEEFLLSAEESYQHSRYDEALQYAKMAERKAKSRMQLFIDAADADMKNRRHQIESRLSGLKVMMRDLERADISIEGAAEDLGQVEIALEDGDFEASEAHLKYVEEIAGVLTSGLEVAAQDLLQRTEDVIQKAGDEGFSVSRGQEVLRNAQAALEDGRYVEVLEYCKVIGDIVEGARRKATLEDMTGHLDSVRKDLDELEAKGLKMPRTQDSLDEIQEAWSRGETEKAREMVEGLDGPLRDLRSAAGLSEMAQQTEEIASQVGEVKEILKQAQIVLETGKKGELRELITQAQARFGEASEGAKSLMQDLREQAELAESLGADVREAKKILTEADASLEDEPDGALKSLERARGIVAKAVKGIEDAEPEIRLEMPEGGLVEGRWTRYVFYVKNAGNVPAKQVGIKLRGDAEVKGFEPIEKLSPGETREIEVGVRPKAEGNIPLDVEVAYRRYFDGVEVQTTSEATVKASRPGTYLVEDVFLVHSDGRLVCHQSRKTLDDIDEDIFSGMLTVVQDFVKDSFRQRTRVGLRRLEFAESKILIERGTNVYLAVVLIGEEPVLLPLYMAEIINEIERAHGERLEKWTGLLSELEGIETIVRKLLFLTQEETIRGPEGTEMAISSAMSLIEGGKTVGMDIAKSEELLKEAQEAVAEDPHKAWALVEDAVAMALKTQQDVQTKLKTVVNVLDSDLEDLAVVGLEDLAELKERYEESRNEVEKAKTALARGDYDIAARIVTSLEDSLSALKEQVASEKMYKEFESLNRDLGSLDSEGVDSSEAKALLEQAREALGKGRLGEVNRCLESADATIRETRDSLRMEKYEGDLEKMTRVFDDPSMTDSVSEEARRILSMATEAAKQSDVDQLGALITQARRTILQRGEGVAGDRQPRLLVRAPTSGFQSNTWNRFMIEIANKGDWAAEDLEVKLEGDAEVKGEGRLEKLGPDEVRKLEMGLWPKSEGETIVDLEVSYKGLLDDVPYVMRELRDLEVAPKSAYGVEDALLYLASGDLLLHESRRYRDRSNKEAFDETLQRVQELIQRIAQEGMKPSIEKTEIGDSRVLAAGGDVVYLVAVTPGEGSELLPLYMLQVLHDIESRYGEELRDWKGDSEILAELRKTVRKLLLVSDSENVDLGPLASSPITLGLLYGLPPNERRAKARALMQKVEEGMKEGGLPTAIEALESSLGRVLAEGGPPSVGARGEGYSVEVDDATLRDYIEIAKMIDKAISKARGKAGLEVHWPVPRIAVRAANPAVASAATSFKGMILSHANAKEVDILEKGELWKGADLKMQINREAIAKSYKVWAKKIELILNSQNPWKIKEGIDKGGFDMGIEGQEIRILPEMVSFQVIIPPHVVVQQFSGGMVFLDTTMTEETKAEGFANEIIKIVLEARKELALEDSQPVSVEIVPGANLKALLLGVREYIMEEVNASRLGFVEYAGETGYVVDCEIRDEEFTLAVREA